MPQFSHPLRLISTDADLADAARALSACDKVAVDTESDNFYRYERRICLIQLSGGGTDYIVDPLAVRDLSPVADLLRAEGIEKLFHGAENDLALFQQWMGVTVAGPVFDTHIAAQVAGESRLGFGALVEAYFGVTLDKRFQLFDWARRPLPDDALDYARGDTHFLLPLRDALWTQVEARGRTAHALEEFGRVRERIVLPAPFDPDGCLKLKGTRALDDRGLRVLRQLYIMREERAKALDLAPFRVLANELLVALAASRPRSEAALAALPLGKDRAVQRLSGRIVTAIAAGMAPDAPRPMAPPSSGPPDPAVEARFNALRRWREKACEKLKMSPGFLAPNALLMAVAARAPRTPEELAEVPGVRRWQVEELGATWCAILARPVSETPPPSRA